jgi:hypothetical protein
MAINFTEGLNWFYGIGGFDYVIPFLLLFAVVFAILQKSKILGENRVIEAIVAASVGLLAIQFGFVSEFFRVIFPRFGVILSIFLVLLIIFGFFWPHDKKSHGSWIGWILGPALIIWALSAWGEWGNNSGFGGWFTEYIWALIVLGGIVAVIILVIKSGKTTTTGG